RASRAVRGAAAAALTALAVVAGIVPPAARAPGTITTIAGTGKAGYSGDGGPATAADLNQPNAVVGDGSGALFIADKESNHVRKVSATGTITTVAGTGKAAYSGDGGPATVAELNKPMSVLLDGSGNLLISDTNNSRVRKVSPSGTITTAAGTGKAGYGGDGG